MRHAIRTCALAALSAVALACFAALPGCSLESAEPASARGPRCIASTPDVICAAKATLRYGEAGIAVTHNGTVSLPMGEVTHGGTYDVRFQVTNSAAAATSAMLHIERIDFLHASDASASGGEPVFACFMADGETPCGAGEFPPIAPVGVAAADSVTELAFVIRYTRRSDAHAHDRLAITLAGDPAHGTQPFNVQINTERGTPRLQLSPSALVFAQVGVDSVAVKSVHIRNTGDAILEVRGLTFEADAAFTLLDPTGHPHKPGSIVHFDLVLVISPGQTKSFAVRFEPEDPHKKLGTVTLHSNDTTFLSGHLTLTGNPSLACVQLSPEAGVDFGVVALGMSSAEEIRVRSCGGDELVVDTIAFGGARSPGEFSLDFSKLNAKYPGVDPKTGPTTNKPLRISVNGEAVFDVVYTPEDLNALEPSTRLPRPDLATITLTSNAVTPTIAMTCSGASSHIICPIATMTIAEGLAVIPQTQLHLSGDQTQPGSSGRSTSYAWTVTQPFGSKQSFSPGPTVANPTFTPLVSGAYAFCLSIGDGSRQKLCKPTCKTVLVVAECALHVELLWHTPLDSDETNTGPAAGADLDLHVAHALSIAPDQDCDGAPDPWFSKDLDTYWANPTPVWASFDSPKSNPKLDLADADGAGPENLNLDEPAGTMAKPNHYHVGVHYWNDHGFGASFATLNVYLLGVLALQIENVKLEELDMWYVGKINWPNAMSAKNMTVDPFEICYQSGDPCDETKPGKHWQPKGDWCVRSCYTPSNGLVGFGDGGAVCKKP